MWKQRKGIWLPEGSEEEKPGKKTADRPHWITILIGIVSPTVGLVALIISLQSLKTSEKAMEVGQRAYVTLENGKYDLLPEDDFYDDQNRFVDTMFWFDARNLGNTPAKLRQMTISYTTPLGWSVSDSAPFLIKTSSSLELRDLDTVIGPKSSVTKIFHVRFKVTPKAFRRYEQLWMDNSAGASSDVFWVHGSISYEDVFGTFQSLSWCWATDILDDYPQSCIDKDLEEQQSPLK